MQLSVGDSSYLSGGAEVDEAVLLVQVGQWVRLGDGLGRRRWHNLVHESWRLHFGYRENELRRDYVLESELVRLAKRSLVC